MIWMIVAAFFLATGSAMAQGCGPTNPNCVVPTAPPGTSDNRAASTAFVRQNSVFSVANNTALKAVNPNSIIGVVFRQGFATPGDGGAMDYNWQAASCSLNAGAGDNGYQVKPNTGGGCWIAQIQYETDVRVWGAPLGGTDDTSIWNAADTAIGTGLKTTLICPTTTNVLNVNFVNTAMLRGNGSCVFNATAAATTIDALINVANVNGFVGSDLKFTSPIYNIDPNAGAVFVQPVINKAIRVGVPSSPSGPFQAIPFVELRHVTFVGGIAGVSALGVTNFTIDDFFADRQWATGVITNVVINGSSQTGSPGGTTSSITIRNGRCRGFGQYCVSTPANVTAASVTPVNYHIHDIQAYGGGFIGAKFCYDFTGTQWASVLISGVMGTNCVAGGAELKLFPTDASPGSTPNYFQGVDFSISYFSNVDVGSGLQLNYENPTAISTPNLGGKYRTNNYTAYLTPGAWQASTTYYMGDVVTNGGNTFMALSETGTSGAGGGPASPGTCAWNAASVLSTIDGTVRWICAAATPSAASQITSMNIEAVTGVDVTTSFFEVGEGVMLIPKGSSDQTIRDVTLHMTGKANLRCLRDQAVPLVNGTVDRLRVIAPQCYAGRNDGGTGGGQAILIGQSTAVSNSIAYTDMEILGGEILHQGVTTGSSNVGVAISCPSTASAPANVVMKIIGTTLGGSTGAFGLTNCPWAITQIGGLLQTTGAGGNEPLAITNSTAVNTTYTNIGSPVAVSNANKTNKATWKTTLSGGGTATVLGTFMAAPSTTFPTWKCNFGDVVPIDPNAGATVGTGNWVCADPAAVALKWSGGIQTVGAGATQIPVCAGGLTGLSTFITDGAANNYNANEAGGGVVKRRILCNGANWTQD